MWMEGVGSRFAQPSENIQVLTLAPGSRVADFGAGSGAYTLALAQMVGRDGKVYAVEVQKELAEKLAAQAIENGLSNVETIWGDIDRVGGSKIVENSLDAVVISNVLFQSEDKTALAKEAFRVLKSGAKALVIDWSASFNGMGPSSAELVTATQGKAIFIEAGFVFITELSAGAQHWGIVVQKP